MTKAEYFEKNGFDINTGYTYCVVGEDTYSIKDHLKEIGGKYNPTLKWHFPTQVALGEDFKLVPIKFDDIMQWDEKNEEAIYFGDAEMKITRALKSALPPSKSEYVGHVGDRLRNLTAVLKSTKTYTSRYGLGYIYSFFINENELIWFTQKEINIEDGTIIDLTATVKQHSEYGNRKQTILSRCIIKKVG